MQPNVFRVATMHQEDEGYEHPRDEDGVYQITLPPAILGNEPRAPLCDEEGTDDDAGQSETGAERAPTVKPPSHQRHMGDEAQGCKSNTDQNSIIEIELPQGSHAATEEKPHSQKHRGPRKHPPRTPPVK